MACLLALVLLAAGCGSDDRPRTAASEPRLASGQAVPTSCVPRPVRPAATVTFVANGYAWALEPRSGRVTCLFAARDPGPFMWGPRGDRALLARLEVEGLASAPTRPAGRVDPPAASWGRPTGKSIVFVGDGGRSLLKAHPAGGGFTDVTPVIGVRYERVVYHPSGLAFAFVVRAGGRELVEISSNLGESPRLLVHGRLLTEVDAIAFGDRGATLYFAAHHADGHVDLHTLPIAGATFAPVLWRSAAGERVTDLAPGRGGLTAFTAGKACASRRALRVAPGNQQAVELLPGERPTRALGWLDDRHALVAAGGCGQKLDLYSVAPGSKRLLVRGVDAASVRRAEPLPAPSLPEKVLKGRGSFA
jgi:hypothetical protein